MATSSASTGTAAAPVGGCSGPPGGFPAGGPAGRGCVAGTGGGAPTVVEGGDDGATADRSPMDGDGWGVARAIASYEESTWARVGAAPPPTGGCAADDAAAGGDGAAVGGPPPADVAPGGPATVGDGWGVARAMTPYEASTSAREGARRPPAAGSAVDGDGWGVAWAITSVAASTSARVTRAAAAAAATGAGTTTAAAAPRTAAVTTAVTPRAARSALRTILVLERKPGGGGGGGGAFRWSVVRKGKAKVQWPWRMRAEEGRDPGTNTYPSAPVSPVSLLPVGSQPSAAVLNED